FEDLRVLSF
nr:Chain B, NP338 peptide [unidentified influenza virus]6MT6_B Chain B, NP388 peptide [unidentified influenza virus]6MTL_C Chain C, NP338 peptide [unidentified influenza virus]6MTM_C Chain C, NP338 influenza peptide [unidentified influenza virus]